MGGTKTRRCPQTEPPLSLARHVERCASAWAALQGALSVSAILRGPDVMPWYRRMPRTLATRRASQGSVRWRTIHASAAREDVAEARTCTTGPAHGVRHHNGRDTKGQPELLYGGHAAMWLMRANRIVHGGHESTDKGCRFSKKHGCLQAIGALSKPIGIEDNFSLTRRRRPRTMAFR